MLYSRYTYSERFLVLIMSPLPGDIALFARTSMLRASRANTTGRPHRAVPMLAGTSQRNSAFKASRTDIRPTWRAYRADRSGDLPSRRDSRVDREKRSLALPIFVKGQHLHNSGLAIGTIRPLEPLLASCDRQVMSRSGFNFGDYGICIRTAGRPRDKEDIENSISKHLLHTN